MGAVTYTRSPSLVALARQASYLFIIAGSAVVISDVDVDELSQILNLTARPITREALLDHCAVETIQTLVDLGVLVTSEITNPPVGPSTSPKRCGRLVVGVSGAVAATMVLDQIRGLTSTFADQLDVILTQNATRFLQPRVFDYHGLQTWTDPYEPAHGISVPHKYLAAADLLLIAPASANTIHRIASGACSDLLSLVVANTTAPIVVAPSMNAEMWAHPPIARNVAQLRRDGIWVIDPGAGFVLSGEAGIGAMGFDLPGLLRALDGVLTATGERRS